MILNQKSSFIVLTLLLSLVLITPSFAKAPTGYAAAVKELTFNAQGSRMSGLAYLAKGQGPHPTILLLHGYPGNEKNLDVAQALRREGWNVVFFHYRGAWGSEGQFSYLNAEQDVQTVLTSMRDPDNTTALRIDPERISLVGHSMGGHMAIAGILDNSAVQCAVAYDGANMGAKGGGLFKDSVAAKMWKDYSDSLFMLAGWSGEKAMQEVNEHGERLDLIRRAKNIGQRGVLLIAADTAVIPIDLHIKPLLSALQATENHNVAYRLIDQIPFLRQSPLHRVQTLANVQNLQLHYTH